jgi:peptidyl-tRNA hydrolase, PTH1 family
MFLIVGLGNPGREYKETRHNVGFMVVDRLCQKWGVKPNRLQSKALIAQSMVGEQKVILAKPQTFMNLSGQAVSSLARFYKVDYGNLLVVHDDLDLPLGTLRLRPSGGSAGQKGLGSTIEQLGTQEFCRLRVGIGRPPGRMDAAGYVLQTFSSGEMETMQFVLARAEEAVMTYLEQGIVKAMNQFNGSTTGGDDR